MSEEIKQWGRTKPRELRHKTSGEAEKKAWGWTEEVTVGGTTYFDTYYAVPVINGQPSFQMPCLLDNAGDYLHFEFTEELADFYEQITNSDKWTNISYFESFLQTKQSTYTEGFVRYIYREEMLSGPDPWEL